MSLLPTISRWLAAIARPDVTPELEAALAERRRKVPVLWLLGKTGAGKTSIVQRLTGDSRAEIGNGFEPCTRNAYEYDHPADHPVMRFLDTRGLGESHYDPQDDLAACQSASHALLIVTRVDDTSQGVIRDALAGLGRSTESLAILHVHSALHTLPENVRQRAITHNRQLIAETLGRAVPQVSIDFTDPDDGFEDDSVGLPALRDALVELVPALEQALAVKEAGDREQRAFAANRTEVLGYSTAAAAIDLLPAVGLIGVPTIQGKLLHALAGRYGLPWNRRTTQEFLAALGTSFLYRYVLSLGGRELAKFIPVYGQTAGAAAAASISFASTYALGRTACLYMYKRVAGEAVETDDLRAAFRYAFDASRDELPDELTPADTHSSSTESGLAPTADARSGTETETGTRTGTRSGAGSRGGRNTGTGPGHANGDEGGHRDGHSIDDAGDSR